jgi:hypothetical protein
MKGSHCSVSLFLFYLLPPLPIRFFLPLLKAKVTVSPLKTPTKTGVGWRIAGVINIALWFLYLHARFDLSQPSYVAISPFETLKVSNQRLFGIRLSSYTPHSLLLPYRTLNPSLRVT